MADLLEKLRARARGGGARIALPEAEDPRVLLAARRALDSDLCRPILVGARAAIETAARDGDVD
ncbi:MAG: phosphate acyltransferase, partial [Acidobacteriota bacterium]